MNSLPLSHEYSFFQWQEMQEQLKQKQSKYVWTASLSFSSLCFLAIIGAFYTHSQTTIVVPSLATEATINLDLASENIAPPPQISSLPEHMENLPETSPSLPSIPVSEINPVLPTVQKLKKINKLEKPTIHTTPQHIHIQKPITPLHHNTITQSSTENNTSQSSTHQLNTNNHTNHSSSPANWYGLVAAKLEKLKHYPAEAQSEEQEGTVILHITLDRQGHLIASSIAKSSGYNLLDKEAIALSHRVDPLPAPPETLKGSVLTLNIPIIFSLP